MLPDLGEILGYVAGLGVFASRAEVDRAMRWGYANAMGPFELWDAIGVEETARRLEAEGRALPEKLARRMLLKHLQLVRRYSHELLRILKQQRQCA